MNFESTVLHPHEDVQGGIGNGYLSLALKGAGLSWNRHTGLVSVWIQFDSLTRWGYLGRWRIEEGKEHPEGDESEKGDTKGMIPEAKWSPRGQR